MEEHNKPTHPGTLNQGDLDHLGTGAPCVPKCVLAGEEAASDQPPGQLRAKARRERVARDVTQKTLADQVYVRIRAIQRIEAAEISALRAVLTSRTRPSGTVPGRSETAHSSPYPCPAPARCA